MGNDRQGHLGSPWVPGDCTCWLHTKQLPLGIQAGHGEIPLKMVVKMEDHVQMRISTCFPLTSGMGQNWNAMNTLFSLELRHPFWALSDTIFTSTQ